MNEYKILKAYRKKELEEKVAEYLNKGWKLHGSHCCTNLGNCLNNGEAILIWSQAVVNL